MLNQHQTIKDNIEKYNKENPLAEYLIPLIGDKTEVEILDIGSGPYSIIGSYLKWAKVGLHLADNQDFKAFWEKQNTKPFYDIEQQDMEHLTYPDESFDIVHCANALDHTTDASQAVQEMIRVCKLGGYVYIDCHLDQKDTGHKHKWNAKEDGRLVSDYATLNLKELGFTIKYIDNGGESRYNKIIAILHKGGGLI